jgi:hypothetical protein
MEDYINESVETQEVADLDTDVENESEETQEVAEPETEVVDNSQEETRTKQDAAFAEQRRRIQELERANEEARAENEQMLAALQRFFDGDNATDLSINANAYAEQRDPEEYRAEYEQKAELERLKADNQSLLEQINSIKVEQLMRDGLKEIQAIDPNVKSLEELGETFAHFIGAGLTSKEAYYATIARDAKEKVQPPDAIGRVNDTKIERDYYTSEELDNLSSDEMDANWDKVMRSMDRLSKH